MSERKVKPKEAPATKELKLTLGQSKQVIGEFAEKRLAALKGTNEKTVEYRKKKAHAMLLEEDNYDSIIVFPSKEAPWYKIGGKSALIYAYDVAPRVCKKSELPQIRPDTDKNMPKSADGILSIRNIKLLIERLAKDGIKEFEIFDDGIYKFKIGRAFSKEEIKGLRAIKYQKGHELDSMAMTKEVYQDLRYEIAVSTRMILPKCKKMDRFYQDALGREMVEKILEMNDEYLEIANGRGEEIKHFAVIVGNANFVLSRLMAIREIEAWNPITTTEIGAQMVKVKLEVRKAMDKKKKERVKGNGEKEK